MTDPSASPFYGITLPPSYGVQQVALQQRATAQARKMRRNDWYRFLVWIATGVLMVAAVAIPRDYWPALGILMGVFILCQAFLMWHGSGARDRYMAVVMEAQFLAATVMHEAFRSGELDRHRDGA